MAIRRSSQSSSSIGDSRYREDLSWGGYIRAWIPAPDLVRSAAFDPGKPYEVSVATPAFPEVETFSGYGSRETLAGYLNGEAVVAGIPLTGTEAGDWILGNEGGGNPNSVIDGRGGEDIIFGDWQFFNASASIVNISRQTAISIDDASRWVTADSGRLSPFNDFSGVFTAVLVEATPSQQEYFRFNVAGPQNVTVDIDFMISALSPNQAPIEVELLSETASLGVFSTTALGRADEGTYTFQDPFFTAFLPAAGAYYLSIRTRPGFVFAGGETYLMGVALQNHANAGALATGSDTIFGGSGANQIYGMGGADTIYGGDSNDLIIDGPGNDIVYGGDAADYINGRESFYPLTNPGSPDYDLIYGGRGNDEIFILNGGEYYGEEGDDKFFVTAWSGPALIDGGIGTDILVVTDSFAGAVLTSIEFIRSRTQNLVTREVIFAGDANSTIETFYGNDEIYAGGGNDIVEGGPGADILDGGDGIDTLSYSRSLAVFVTLLFSTVNGSDAQGDVISNFENITGSNFNDNLGGDNLANVINGGFGDDVISGGGGDDVLLGGSGDDLLTGGDGNDQLFGESFNDTLRGENGDDLLDGGDGDDLLESGAGADVLLGGAGDDGLFFGAFFTAADRADGGAGSNDQVGLQGDYSGANALVIGADTIVAVEVIALLSGSVRSFGDTANNFYDYTLTVAAAATASNNRLTIQASTLRAGEDFTFDGSASAISFITYGGLGVDTLTGGSGNDGFYFGQGRFSPGDSVNGGAGLNDQLGLDGNYGTGGAPFILSGANISGVELVAFLQKAGAAPHSYVVASAEDLVAAGQTMIIYGLAVLTGFSFDGSAETDGGAFRFFGGAGAETLIGSSGGDWFLAGFGGDTLRGGAGADTFVCTSASQSTGAAFDRLVGFDSGEDRIDLPGTVASFAAPVSGSLSLGSFDADLAASVDGALAGGQAILFTAASGDMAGRVFGVIDANGDGNYQAGSDYVFEFVAPVSPIDQLGIFI